VPAVKRRTAASNQNRALPPAPGAAGPSAAPAPGAGRIGRHRLVGEKVLQHRGPYPWPNCSVPPASWPALQADGFERRRRTGNQVARPEAAFHAALLNYFLRVGAFKGAVGPSGSRRG